VTLKAALTIAALAAATGAAADRPEASTVHLEGRCDYRPAAANVGPDTGFAACDSVTIVRDGANSAIDFEGAIPSAAFRYEGVLSGDTMIIHRLRIGDRAPQDATGKCTVFHRDDRISTVTCVAKAGRKTFAANFVTSRIDPDEN
jgi:hypothetical protein